MTRLFPSGRVGAAALLVGLAGLGGCELLKNNEQVQTTINSRVLGMPAGDFFDRYGRASSRTETPDGMTYDWTSSVRYAPPGPEGLDDRVCKLRLGADRQGRINAVQVQYDAPGTKSTSRCGEIFGAK